MKTKKEKAALQKQLLAFHEKELAFKNFVREASALWLDTFGLGVFYGGSSRPDCGGRYIAVGQFIDNKAPLGPDRQQHLVLGEEITNIDDAWIAAIAWANKTGVISSPYWRQIRALQLMGREHVDEFRVNEIVNKFRGLCPV